MSLLDLAQSNKSTAIDSYSNLSGLHQQRETNNDQLKTQKRSRQASAIGSGISTGATVAMLGAGGPAGIAVGAGIMLLGGLF